MPSFAKSLLSFVAIAAIACSAAPIQPQGYLALMSREAGEVDAREFAALEPEAREIDDADELKAREEDIVWLAERMNNHGWPGPGMQHRNEHVGVPTTGYHPVPHNTYYPTHNNVYSGAQVNQYAQSMVNSVPHAAPYSRKANGKLKSYPKPSTGFRNTESQNPAPNHPQSVSYHAPIPPRRGRANTLPGRPGGSFKVGTDRVYGHRNVNDGRLHVGVSYHDPHRPIPAPPPGGTPSRNHPFSVAPQKKGNPVTRLGAKIKQGFAKVIGRPAKKALKRTNTY